MRTDLKTLDELQYEPAPWYAQAFVLIGGAVVGAVVVWQIVQLCRPSQVEDLSPSEAVQAIHSMPDYPGQHISGGGRTFSPAKPADSREVRR